MRNVIAALPLLCLPLSPLHAQDWTAVQTLPADTPVRVEEVSRPGHRLHGRLATVEDARLTLLVRGKPIVIARASIGRVERERRDPLWNGMMLGAALSLAMRVAFAGEACARTADPQCTIQGTLVGAALGAFIDYQIKGHRLIYVAPPPTVTFLRMSF
jgi:hypothetical protein